MPPLTLPAAVGHVGRLRVSHWSPLLPPISRTKRSSSMLSCKSASYTRMCSSEVCIRWPLCSRRPSRAGLKLIECPSPTRSFHEGRSMKRAPPGPISPISCPPNKQWPLQKKEREKNFQQQGVESNPLQEELAQRLRRTYMHIGGRRNRMVPAPHRAAAS